jgi:hypothetical protein
LVAFGDLHRLATGLTGEPLRIGRIGSALSRRLGAYTTVVWLSHQTMTKQLLRHPDLQLQDYLFVDHILRTGAVFPGRGGSLAFIHAPPDRDGLLSFKVVVKVTGDGELYMTTFHRLRAAEVRRAFRRDVAIRGPWTWEE